MSHSHYRLSFLAFAALMIPATRASGQFIDVLTEAPVTLQVTMQSVTTTTAGGSRTTNITATRLTNAQVLEELRVAGIIHDTSITGWSLVAVRDAPSDLDYVDAGFYLYAIKGNTAPVAVPSSKFVAAAHASVAAYVEKNQGRYVLTSKGTVTNHIVCQYNPTFVAGSTAYAIDSSESCGFAKINFVTKDLSDNYEVFFYALSSVTVTANGGFTANSATSPTTGLCSLALTVGTPKLKWSRKTEPVS